MREEGDRSWNSGVRRLQICAAGLSSLGRSSDDGFYWRFRSLWGAFRIFDFVLTISKNLVEWTNTSLRFVSTAGRRAVPKGAALAFFTGEPFVRKKVPR